MQTQRDCSESTHSEGIIDKLIDYELVSEGAAYFANGEYESAIVGVTDDGCFVYDFWKMVEYTMENSDCSPEQAYDHVASSICNFVPVMGEKHPVIFYSLEDLAL